MMNKRIQNAIAELKALDKNASICLDIQELQRGVKIIAEVKTSDVDILSSLARYIPAVDAGLSVARYEELSNEVLADALLMCGVGISAEDQPTATKEESVSASDLVEPTAPISVEAAEEIHVESVAEEIPPVAVAPSVEVDEIQPEVVGRCEAEAEPTTEDTPASIEEVLPEETPVVVEVAAVEDGCEPEVNLFGEVEEVAPKRTRKRRKSVPKAETPKDDSSAIVISEEVPSAPDSGPMDESPSCDSETIAVVAVHGSPEADSPAAIDEEVDDTPLGRAMSVPLTALDMKKFSKMSTMFTKNLNATLGEIYESTPVVIKHLALLQKRPNPAPVFPAEVVNAAALIYQECSR